jgi:peptidoglycan hydrolase-like protein with peptidoglycan-binding domain
VRLDQEAYEEALELAVRFDPTEHPRDLKGRWRNVLKGIRPKKSGKEPTPKRTVKAPIDYGFGGESADEYEAVLQGWADVPNAAAAEMLVKDTTGDVWVSHSAGKADNPDWWIVKAPPGGMDAELQSLRGVNRRVLHFRDGQLINAATANNRDLAERRAAIAKVVTEAQDRATDVAKKSRDHGPKHWRDVAHMGLAQIKAGVPADPDVLVTFAALHDTQRWDEWQDPEHGPRAADLADELREDGFLDYLSDEQFQKLTTALETHNGSPGDPDVTIGAALDADRYTLWRVGQEPDFKYMSGAENGHLTEPEMLELKAYSAQLVGTKGFEWVDLLDQWELVAEHGPGVGEKRRERLAAKMPAPAEGLPRYARTSWTPGKEEHLSALGGPRTPLDAEVLSLHLARERKKRQGGTLRWGSRNARAVKAVQERLSAIGLPVEVDGAWGSETEAAFRAFQQQKGLKVDGVLGPKSLAAMLKAKPKDPNAADPSMDAVTRVVEKGGSQPARRTSGLGEARAQQRGGGDRSAGGSGGDARSEARERLRRKRQASKGDPGDGGLKKNEARDKARRRRAAAKGDPGDRIPRGPNGGRIDPVTKKEIATSTTGPIGATTTKQPSNMSFEEAHPRGEAGSPTGGQFVMKGSSGEQVTNSQKALNRADKSGLEEDGDFGPKTEEAVKKYQQKTGLAVDGIVGPKTSAQLRRDLYKLKAKQKRPPKRVGARTPRKEEEPA